MNDTKLDSPEAIKAFLSGTNELEFQVSKATRYSFLASTLKRTNLSAFLATKPSLRGTKQPRVQSSEPWVASFLAMTDLYPLRLNLGLKLVRTPSAARGKQPRKREAPFQMVTTVL